MVHYQLIAMNAEEADERGIEDLTGLESAMPGLARAVQTFFRVYKVLFLNGFLVILVFLTFPNLQVPAGDEENQFAYDGEIQDKALAEDVVM